MKSIIFSVFILLSVPAVAQVTTNGATQIAVLAPYQQFPSVPPFTITRLPDSTQFSKQDLKARTATIFMIFSPDCDHCQHATEDMIAHMSKLKKVQIVMATPLEYKFIPSFYNKYKLSDYKNVTVGRDPNYFLGHYFDVHNFPSIYLYDKRGNFTKAFVGSVSFDKIIASL